MFSIWPLLAPGYFLDAHDGPHSLFFLVEFDKAIQDGALVPRWGADHALGYGYPTFVFYSPLAYYVAEAFHLLGASIVAAVKATYALAMILSALGMFLLVGEFSGPVAAFLAAILYTYAPYRFVDMYVRSALAESCALALFPWALWAFLKLTRQPTARRVALAAASYGALLLCHSVTAVLFTPLLVAAVVFVLVRYRQAGQWHAWALAAAAGFLGIALSAMTLIPSLAEQQYIAQEQWTQATYSLSDHFVYFGQLFSPFWGYEYAVPGAGDGMSFQVGLPLVTLAAGGMVLGWRSRCQRPHVLFFTGALAIYTFFLLPISAPVWQALPPLALAQFPWRLSGIVALCAAALVGSGFSSTNNRGQAKFLWPLLALVSLVSSLPYAVPQHTAPSPRSETALGIIDFEVEHPDMRGMTAWAQHPPEDSPKLAAYQGQALIPLAETSVQGAEITTLHAGGHVQRVLVLMPQSGELRFHTYYYPGWHAYVDGREVPLRPVGELGVIALDIPTGEHTIIIHFEDTPLRAAAKYITLGAVAIIIFLSLPLRKLTSGGQVLC